MCDKNACNCTAGICCICLLLIILFLYGIVFTIFGALPLQRILHLDHITEEFFLHGIIRNKIQYYILAAGLFAILVCLLAIVGICLIVCYGESKCFFYWLALTVILAIVADIILMVEVENINGRIADEFRLHLNNYGKNKYSKSLVDHVQRKYICCGVESYQDYEKIPMIVPLSCCGNSTLDPLTGVGGLDDAIANGKLPTLPGGILGKKYDPSKRPKFVSIRTAMWCPSDKEGGFCTARKGNERKKRDSSPAINTFANATTSNQSPYNTESIRFKQTIHKIGEPKKERLQRKLDVNTPIHTIQWNSDVYNGLSSDEISTEIKSKCLGIVENKVAVTFPVDSKMNYDGEFNDDRQSSLTNSSIVHEWESAAKGILNSKKNRSLIQSDKTIKEMTDHEYYPHFGIEEPIIVYVLPPHEITSPNKSKDNATAGSGPILGNKLCKGCLQKFREDYAYDYFVLYYCLVVLKMILVLAVGVSPCWMLIVQKDAYDDESEYNN